MLAMRFSLAWDETSTEATDSDADGALRAARAKQAARTRNSRIAVEETNAAKVKAIRAMRAQGKRIRRIAADLGVGVGTVLRITGPFACRIADARIVSPWTGKIAQSSVSASSGHASGQSALHILYFRASALKRSSSSNRIATLPRWSFANTDRTGRL
jgi:hypothetical protein